MSRLIASDAGHLVVTVGEEVGGRRQARTVLDLAGATTLYVLARSQEATSAPLEVRVGENLVGLIPARDDATPTWHEVPLPSGVAEGPVPVTLASAREGYLSTWSLGLDHTVPGGDELSLDGGRTWSAEHLGTFGIGPGRYMVRARTALGTDPAPPSFVWEDPAAPVVAAFADLLPAAAREADSPWAAVRALSTWVSRAWRYRNTSETLQYAPWDPFTILDWGRRERGHAGNPPVVMCVHYAIVFVAACQALGIPARCAPITAALNSMAGHFVAEVWSDPWERWVMVDPNFDLVLTGPDGTPLDLGTIRDLGDRFTVDAGPGLADHLARPAERAWYDSTLLTGAVYRQRAVWPRSDFLTHPELTPPGHGAAAYCELELVWDARSRDQGCGMFRYFADRTWFEAPPTI